MTERKKWKAALGAGIATFLISTAADGDSAAYSVREGDTLYRIAQETLGDGALWSRLAELNKISAPYTIRPGQVLRLSAELIADTDPTEVRKTSSRGGVGTRKAADQAPAEADHEAVLIERARANLTLDFRPNFVPDQEESLDHLVAELMARDPALRAAEEAARATRFRPSQAGSLPDPMLRAVMRRDPRREIMVSNGTASVRERTMTMPMFQLSQMIPLGKLGPMADLEEAKADAAREMIDAVRASRRSQLKMNYAELYYVDRSSATLVRMRGILDLLVGSVEAMYRSGEARQADLLRAHLELSTITDRLLTAEARRKTLAATINGLLDRRDTTLVGTPEELHTYPIVAAEKLLDTAPTVRLAAVEVEAARRKVAVAKSMFIPDLELMAGTMINEEVNPRYEVGIGVSLPIWGKTKQTPGILEAEAELRAAEERLRGARADVHREGSSGLAMAKASHAQAQLYHTTIIPQARLTLDASLSHYRVGNIDFMTVVENTKTLLEYEIARSRAVAEFYRAVAIIEEASGIEMEWLRDQRKLSLDASAGAAIRAIARENATTGAKEGVD